MKLILNKLITVYRADRVAFGLTKGKDVRNRTEQKQLAFSCVCDEVVGATAARPCDYIFIRPEEFTRNLCVCAHGRRETFWNSSESNDFGATSPFVRDVYPR